MPTYSNGVTHYMYNSSATCLRPEVAESVRIAHSPDLYEVPREYGLFPPILISDANDVIYFLRYSTLPIEHKHSYNRYGNVSILFLAGVWEDLAWLLPSLTTDQPARKAMESMRCKYSPPYMCC